MKFVLKFNSQLILVFQSTELIINNPRVSLVNGRMNCEFTWMFGGIELLSPNEKQRVSNLSQPTLEVFMMFARGSADPYSEFI
jgi:hypothetical protein